MGYENRIVGYADILGWTSACNDVAQYDSLKKVAESIKNQAKKFSPQIKERMQNTQEISQELREIHSNRKKMVGLKFLKEIIFCKVKIMKNMKFMKKILPKMHKALETT